MKSLTGAGGSCWLILIIFLQLLTTDMSLVKAMCAVCPSHEVDDLTIALLNIFEPRGLTFVLLEELIKQEVDDTC